MFVEHPLASPGSSKDATAASSDQALGQGGQRHYYQIPIIPVYLSGHFFKKKSRKWETQNLLTDADNSTDTIIFNRPGAAVL